MLQNPVCFQSSKPHRSKKCRNKHADHRCKNHPPEHCESGNGITEVDPKSTTVRILEQKYTPPYPTTSESDVELATVLITFPSK